MSKSEAADDDSSKSGRSIGRRFSIRAFWKGVARLEAVFLTAVTAMLMIGKTIVETAAAGRMS